MFERLHFASKEMSKNQFLFEIIIEFNMFSEGFYVKISKENHDNKSLSI